MPERIGRLSSAEFTVLLAMAISLTALGIDLMLPAFPQIRSDLGLPVGSPATSGLITWYFLGLAVGQLLFGPLADRFGRRTTMRIGLAVYALGALAAALAPSLTWLFVARALWGFGAAGSRVVVFAIVRDVYDGDRMARAMSTIMAIFILVPVVAPSLGAVIAGLTSWRWLFASCLLIATALALWTRRLPETLAPQHRLELRFGRILVAARVVVRSRVTVAYGLGITALFGSFTAWLGSAELVISETFGQRDLFPILFGVLAGAMGVAAFTNGRIVERVGARRLAHGMLAVYIALAGLLTLLAVATDGRPPLALFLVVMVPMIGSLALIMPNSNTLAMQPMAAVAGTASALLGSVQTAGGALIGTLIDRRFDGTVLPISVGFLVLGLVAAVCIYWGARLQAPARDADDVHTVNPVPTPDPA